MTRRITTKIKGWLKDIFTDDKEDVCIARTMAVLSFLAFLAYAIYGLMVKDHYALADFASGTMQVLLGSAGIIAGKNLTEK